MMRACWCAASELQPFSAEYEVCVSCGTLVSRFHHDRDVARVSSDDSDLYGKDYWFGHMENDLGFANIYQRARTDLTERDLHWLKTLHQVPSPPAAPRIGERTWWVRGRHSSGPDSMHPGSS
jgi:hypothetical protein